MNGTMNENCAVCNVPAVQKCSACKSVFYCNREHQKQHWKSHSKTCRPFKIAENPEIGRHYISLRKVEVDEVILREDQPLVTGPLHGITPGCLGCYCPLNAETAVPCTKCGWPLCKDCKNHGAECEFTCKYKKEKVLITDFDYPHPTYRCVPIIRALWLRENDPESYMKFINLEDHSMAKGKANIFDEPRDTAQFVRRFFKIDHVTEDEVTRIGGILQINGHEVPTTEVPHMAVYDLASMLEHNCRANCRKSFTNKGGIVIRAAIPIAKGDHITICYTDPLWGVTNRRHHLMQTKYFNCACERCKDPTEMGTMFNAVKCTKGDCKGYMLPPTFISNDNSLPNYLCNKCTNSVTWESIDGMMERIGIDLSEMKKDDVEACRTFIQHYSNVLHENHFYLTDVKLALAQIIGQEDGGLPMVSDEILNEKIILCKKLNDLLKTLVPAENRVRGFVLFEMHAAIAEFGRRQGRNELAGILIESKKALSEAYELLKHEPEILPEGKIAAHARKNLHNMDIIIETVCRNTANPM
ncbi:protein msta [Cephus cinctus]|uniref:Protein msta n=1 Tax=Cephus cinctus TaxID=211228 RepID=A0AAJ7FF89_CEPCN|nr:protein msta [Cephus cinctus]